MPRLDAEYLYCFLRSTIFYDQVNQLKSGVAQPQLPIRDIKRIRIPIPKRELQRKIAEVVRPYDRAIENNELRIGLLERSARLLFEEWFVRLRYPGYERDKIVSGVPKGWEKLTVPEIIDINPKEHTERDKELFYVPMAALSEQDMTFATAYFERRTKHTNVRFRNGDTLFARITPCLENGKTGFVSFLPDGEIACGSTEFIVLRGRSVTPQFVYCLARSDRFRGIAIKSMTGSSGQQRVSESCFDDFCVTVAPQSIMAEFDKAAVANFDQIKLLSRESDLLRRARDLLLPRLMDGRISV